MSRGLPTLGSRGEGWVAGQVVVVGLALSCAFGSSRTSGEPRHSTAHRIAALATPDTIR